MWPLAKLDCGIDELEFDMMVNIGRHCFLFAILIAILSKII